MAEITPAERARLAALLGKATPGEWRLRYPSNGGVCVVRGQGRGEESTQVHPVVDGELMHAAVTELPRLIATIRALRAERDGLAKTYNGLLATDGELAAAAEGS